MTVLELRDIHRTYRRGAEEVHALRGIDLDITAGELVAISGPSGSGKTTLLNIVAGWERADRGTIVWRGESRVSMEDIGWGELGIVSQTLGVLDELTVEENVELALRLGGVPRRELEPLLERLGLDVLADRRPEEVSLGERQRVAIGRALSRHPVLVLADEPTGHQDATWAEGVVAALRHATREHGTSCLIATHDDDVLEVVDRVARLRDGRMVDLD